MVSYTYRGKVGQRAIIATGTTKSYPCTTTMTAAVQLRNFGSQNELRQFLKAIQPKFLKDVDPVDGRGLVDTLVAADLMTDTDLESVSGKDVRYRKEQSRKVWFLLNKMSVANFMTAVAPKLVKEYPHIIPNEFLVAVSPQQSTTLVKQVVGVLQRDAVKEEEEEPCFLHEMKSKVRLASIADLLYYHGNGTPSDLEQYESVTTNNLQTDEAWCCLLHSLKSGGSTAGFLPALRALLERYQVQIPEQLGRMLSCGLQCSCQKERVGAYPPPTPTPVHALRAEPAPVMLQQKVSKWMETSEQFGSSSARSSGSSNQPRSVYSQMTATASVPSDSVSLSRYRPIPHQPNAQAPLFPCAMYHAQTPSQVSEGSVVIQIPEPQPKAVHMQGMYSNSYNVSRSEMAHSDSSATCFPRIDCCRCFLPCARHSQDIFKKNSGVLKFLATNWLNVLCVIVLAVIAIFSVSRFFGCSASAVSQHDVEKILYNVLSNWEKRHGNDSLVLKDL